MHQFFHAPWLHSQKSTGGEVIRIQSTKHEAIHNLLSWKSHFQPEAPVCTTKGFAPNGEVQQQLMIPVGVLHISQCHLVLACLEIVVFLVTRDKLVRLIKRIRSVTSVAYCSCMCVFSFLLAHLFVFVCFLAWLMTRGEFRALLSLCVLFAEWCGDLSPYPILTSPFSLGLCSESLWHSFCFYGAWS